MDQDNGIVIPHDSGAEAALLGAMLLRSDISVDMVDRLKVEHFYTPAHKHIFAAVASLCRRGEVAVDVVTVSNELQTMGLSEAVGGAAKLIDLQTNCPSINNATAYANVVLDKAQRRKLMEAANEIRDSAVGALDAHSAIVAAERFIGDAADVAGKDVTATHVSEMFDEHFERLESLKQTKGELIGVPSGYAEVDSTLMGFQGGQMVVVGARPAMGKTSLALGMAANVAQVTQRPVLFFSLEMSRFEVVDRLISGYARIPLKNVRSGEMTVDETERYTAVYGASAELPLYVVDEPAVDLSRIRMEIRKLKQNEGDIAMVVIDYLQLMTPGGGTRSREQEVSEMSRGLKLTAKEFDVPVIALSQLSRNLEQRADKRPILADLRESGSIEQDADIVLFVYRDEIYHPETPDIGTAEVIIAKHRQGATGTCRVGFIPSYALFANLGAGSAMSGTKLSVGDDLPVLAGKPEAPRYEVDFTEPRESYGNDEF